MRPDDADEAIRPVVTWREPLHRRIGRWLSVLVADREPNGQSPNLIRNSDGTGGTVISNSHGGSGSS